MSSQGTLLILWCCWTDLGTCCPRSSVIAAHSACNHSIVRKRRKVKMRFPQHERAATRIPSGALRRMPKFTADCADYTENEEILCDGIFSTIVPLRMMPRGKLRKDAKDDKDDSIMTPAKDTRRINGGDPHTLSMWWMPQSPMPGIESPV